LFALLSMGIANCYILDWDAKFHYQFWRPLTAIRNGDQDGNDATERDAGWLALNATPMHPEYPSQAGINAGTARSILESVFRAGPESFAVTDVADARLQRRFASRIPSVSPLGPRLGQPSIAAVPAWSASTRLGADWGRGACGDAAIRMQGRYSRTPTSRSLRPTCSPASISRSSCAAASTASNT